MANLLEFLLYYVIYFFLDLEIQQIHLLDGIRSPY